MAKKVSSSKKTSAKKAPAKKAVAKKAVAKKAVAKKAVAKKAVAVKKKPVTNAAPVKKAAPKKVAPKPTKKAPAKPAVKKPVVKKAAVKKATKPTPPKKATKAEVPSVAPKSPKKKEAKVTPVAPAKKAKGGKASSASAKKSSSPTPSFIEVPRSARKEEVDPRRGIPLFTLEEALQIMKVRAAEKAEAARLAQEAQDDAFDDAAFIAQPKRVHKAASIMDLLGFNPLSGESKAPREEDSIDKKWLPYYKTLIELRNQLNDGLVERTEETLKRLSRDDAGDVSAYSQHLADAGTENFERDFALSILSSEQETLYEIEEAIKRIKSGNYGVCEITGKPIARDRLKAIPFARYSVEGQVELEKQRRRGSQSRGIGTIFQGDEDTPTFTSDEDSDE
jgi:RNA polymerase-binding transcription factor DksA